MTGPTLDKDIELDGILAAHGFLIEAAFAVICELHPQGKYKAFQVIEDAGLDVMQKSAANLKTNRNVHIFVEAERQLKKVLTRLSSRIHG